MGRKSVNGIICGRVHGLRFSASLTAVLGIIGLLGASAAAAEQVAAHTCNSAHVNDMEAKTIAGSMMRELGWTGSGSFRSTIATRFRIREAECVQGQWQVSVSLSQGSSRSREAFVLINCHTGESDAALRSA